MRILITGSNGYIGAYACDYFSEGNYIIGVGRKNEAQSHVDQYIKCDFARDDVKQVLREVFSQGIDVVYHIAADNRKEPYGVDVIKSNCVGTQALLELAEEYRVESFVQLSSIPVIGTPTELPITPQHPLEPPTIYHATKCLQELLADYAYRSTGLRTVSIRIPSPMGPGVNPRYIFPTFIKKAMNGEDICLYGTGSRKQTYVHVSDVCQAMKLASQCDCQGTYVLGSPHLISNVDLARTIIEVLHSDSKIIFTGQEDKYDSQIWQIDDEPLKCATGYEAKVTLEEMIKEYCSYICEQGEK